MAILRADAVMPEFVDRHGDYPEMFEQLLRTAATACDPPLQLQVTDFDVRVGEYPQADAFDGYLITGSRDSVYDDEPWIGELAGFLKEVLRAGRKVVGICFGHQLIAHFFGGETAPAENGWAVGVQENRTIAFEPWMDSSDTRLNLIASHKDQVIRMPDGAKLIASSDFCPVGGFIIGGQVLTLQGHPEFDRDYSRDLMVMRREMIGEETFEQGVASLAKETDEARVGQWIINFLSSQEEEI